MRVVVKTLKNSKFSIDVNLQDTVADVKRIIETKKGYPAAKQMLICDGKVLKDDTTLEQNQISENSCILIMISSKDLSSSAPPPTPVAAPPPSQPSSSTIPTSSTTVYHPTHPFEVMNLARHFRHILDTSGGRWDRDTAIDAMEYLITGQIPTIAYPDQVAGDQQPPPQDAQPPPAPSTGPNTTPLNLFPQDRPAGACGILDLLGDQEEDGSEQPAPGVTVPPVVTNEDLAAMARLEAMGFEKWLVWEVYFYFSKNEQEAADYLVQQSSRSGEH